MKLGTDSVLLGAWAPILPNDTSILDVGTGTGVVALMLAQRCANNSSVWNDVQIDAIDIDSPSVDEARHNFEISPWPEHLKVYQIPLQEYSCKKYDLIVSNPPYFVNSLKAPSHRRSFTRHSDTLPHVDLIDGAFRLLKDGGRLVVILPKEEGDMFIKTALLRHIDLGEKRVLALKTVCRVSTTQVKPPKRLLIELILSSNDNYIPKREEVSLSLQNDENYNELVRDFLPLR